MLNLTAKIKIGGRVFTSVASVKITTSVEDFMDTATLVLPQVERGQVKENDEVSIELGYENVCMNYEFFGKVSEISPASPYEIRCLDPFNELRRKYLQRNFESQPIHKILLSLLKDTGYSLDVSPLSAARKRNVKLSAVTFDGYKNLPMTVRKAIAKLATDHGYFAYFEGRRLVFNDRNLPLIFSKVPLYKESENIIENSLLYHEGETVKKVTVYSDSKGGIPLRGSWISQKVKNSTIEKKFDVSGFSSDGDCIRRAKELSDQLNAPGYTGDLKTFGYPFVRAGQLCAIQMKTEKQPTIQAVKGTEVSFDSGGYRRRITPTSTTNDVYSSNPFFSFQSLNYFGRVAS